jgi:alkylhydroperoxidase family enzyme
MARVPYIKRDDLPESQQNIYDNISKTRGHVANVFSALLNNPEATKAVTTVGEYIRYNSHLDPIIRETAILTTANEMNNGYEWAQHEPIAREVGVRDEVIDSILSGKGPMGLPAKEGIFIQSAKELVKNGTLTSRTYQALEHLLGPQVTIDFLVTVGYYSMLSRLIHSLDVDFDEGLTLNDQFETN